MHIVLTHENADFDAIASLLGVVKLHPEAVAVLPSHINSNAAAFIALYSSALPFMPRQNWRRQKVERLTLVDTQKVQLLRGIGKETPVDYIDHHTPTAPLRPQDTRLCENVGATTTLLIEQMIDANIAVNSLEATLLALGIYEDTGSFTYGRTTDRDLQAATWLLRSGAVLDTVRRFLSMPLNDEQQSLLEQLVTRVEHRSIQGYAVAIASARVENSIAEVSRVAHRLGEMLDLAALVTLVQTPSGTHLICRSITDDIDVAAVARAFGGGGHPRAAAATLSHPSLEALVADLWSHIAQTTRPAVRIAQLMSQGVHTVHAQDAVGDIIGKIRRIGHEGYPVLDNGRVVGLLTRRDADRAVEHGLGRLQVREIMESGSTQVTPDDSVEMLETLIVESGWGQIPVVGRDDKLLGIVTRTDLIKHWAHSHPHVARADVQVSPTRIEETLGKDTAVLIRTIADIAADQNATLYMVGGCVRDLLLQRKNLDLDFVVEGDAIAFAKALAKTLGGHISSFPPFGTAKWWPDQGTIDTLDVAQLPDHIDFASARNEFYEHPTALPTVYNGSIKLDLLRRDFTINTLAIQIAPQYGRVIDFYGGLQDLQSRLIRVLHSLSFIDDPTRILRAVRFEQRLGFAIEARTAALIESALPMLGRITGERIRSELELLFKEDAPEAGLSRLLQIGALNAIHPALALTPETIDVLRTTRAAGTPDNLMPQMPQDSWIVLAATLSPTAVSQICERLLITGSLQTMMTAAALLRQREAGVREFMKPSEIVNLLKDHDERVLRAVFSVSNNPIFREFIARYINQWQHIVPRTNGHTLIALGIKPGPCFQRILTRLRAGILDDEFSHDQEIDQVHQWLAEGICDDNVS